MRLIACPDMHVLIQYVRSICMNVQTHAQLFVSLKAAVSARPISFQMQQVSAVSH